MARPLKRGLSYFPLDTNILSDRKIQRLSRRYGCNGLGVYVAVLCEIYGENGYYVLCDADFCFDIAFTLGIREEEVREIFRRLKCGRYGRFYGMVDALFITSALLQFVEERRKEVAHLKAVRAKATDEKPSRSASTGIVYDEYLALKKQKELNHEKE